MKTRRKRKETPVPELTGYVTVTQFAQHFSLAKTTIFAAIHAKKLTAIRIGAVYRIPRTEVNRVEAKGL